MQFKETASTSNAEPLPPGGTTGVPAAAWLLGTDWKQRLRTKRSLGAAVSYLVALVLLHLAVSKGLLPQEPMRWLTAAIGITVAGFYVLLRVGVNRAFKHASLTMPQMQIAVIYAAAVYAMGGPVRNIILLVLVPLLMFGFKHLRPVQIRVLAIQTVAVMGLAMTWLVVTLPRAYDAPGEMVRFMLLCVAVAMSWQLSGHQVEEAGGSVGRMISLVFTDDPKQRLRIQRFMVSAVNFVICTAFLSYGITSGMVDRVAGTLLSVYMMTQVTAFYILLRSGLNQRFADPALTMPQIVVALTCVAGAYAVLRELRGAALMLMVMVLLFGLFNLSARQARLCAYFALFIQGFTMLGMTRMDPVHYPVRDEIILFLFACTVLPTISLLAGQLSELRARLRARKEELAAALGKIEALAIRDDLTGLFNRRHMREVLAQQKRVCDRGGRIFCIGIFDIDHFKKVNDTHGHTVGDDVLRAFAHTLEKALRASDVVARWGGEEFLVMFSECRKEHAQIFVSRVAAAMQGAAMSAAVPDLRVTFSGGVAEQRYDETLEQTIARADQALYRAKQKGRNRVEIALYERPKSGTVREGTCFLGGADGAAAVGQSSDPLALALPSDAARGTSH